jgi:type II secretory pathway predicted ATPase ExeA
MSNEWTKAEKKIARQAFDAAYQRECAAIIAAVQKQAAEMKTPEDIWKLEEYLYEKRRDIDETYDYRYSVLLMVFGGLLQEGWLSFDELSGLSEDKLESLRLLLNFAKDYKPHKENEEHQEANDDI